MQLSRRACFVVPAPVLGTVASKAASVRSARTPLPGRSVPRASAATGDKAAGRIPWPIGRFARTAFWFSPLGKMLRPPPVVPTMADSSLPPPPSRTGRRILVTGASGATGSRVVKCLLEDGTTVRALVRSEKKAREALTKVGVDVDSEVAAGKLELIVSDLYNLAYIIFQGVDAVISTTGTSVGPQGDTPDRALYLQGLRFYKPAVLADTPENVEYIGVKSLAENIAHIMRAQDVENQVIQSKILVHDDLEKVEALWGSLDDVVMGGVSRGSVSVADGMLKFSGIVSEANSGGFSSIRSANLPSPLDLSSYEGIRMRVKGGGRRYKFIMRCDKSWDGISHCYSFDTADDDWCYVTIPFAAFNTVRRAKTVPEEGPFDPSCVSAFQIMYSKFEYDRAFNPGFEPGPFELLVDSVYAYKTVYPRYVHLTSAQITKVFRKDEFTEDTLPPIVKLQEQLGRILEWKLAGEDAIRKSMCGLGYTIVRSTALTVKESVGLDSLVIDQGDNLTGEMSRDNVARLLVESMYQPLSGKTFEVGELRSSDDATPRQSFASTAASLKEDIDATERKFCEFPYVPK